MRDGVRFDNLPQRFGYGGFFKYLMLPKGTRLVIRNYTIRQFSSASGELDIDFIVHGTDDIAAPWAASVQPGSPVAFIDQAHGWAPVPAERFLIVADGSAMPAALAILRDIPRDAVGDAIIKLFDEKDKQDVDAPEGVAVYWVIRYPQAAPVRSPCPLSASYRRQA